MWLFFGISAIITTALHLIFYFKGKETKWFRFFSLSFTALTVCAFYSAETNRVLQGDWAGLIDVMPFASKGLWGCVIFSILINGISLFKDCKHES